METRARLGHQGVARASSFADLSLYIIFFPQLVAGPIVKARNFIDQIREKLWTDIDWVQVRRYLVSGYFLKIFGRRQPRRADRDADDRPEGAGRSDPVNLMALLYGYGSRSSRTSPATR